MAENSGSEKSPSPLREILRKRRVRLWIGGALVALVGGISLVGFALDSLPSWFVPLGLMGLGATTLLLVLAFLWKFPQWQVRNVSGLDAKERFDRINEARKTLATILGGIVLLVGAFFSWRNFNLAQEALTVSQQGQLTDRLTKAVVQLGAVDTSVRLLGIYTLEQIASDSEAKPYHRPIIGVLCMYVRNNAPRKPQESNQKNQASTARPHIAGDIQSILTFLGDPTRDRRPYGGMGEIGQNFDLFDLSNTDIRGASLSGADFRWWNLSKADLSWANLIFANLSNADLRGANLNMAYLNGANFSGADLSGADLSNNYLSVVLTQEQIDLAKGDVNSRLPANLHQPESWKK